MIVEGKGKSLGVTDRKAKGFLGQIFGGRFGVDRQNVHIVSGFGEELEHFLEAIGVSGDVGEGSGFYHQADLARRVSSKRWSSIGFTCLQGRRERTGMEAGMGRARILSAAGGWLGTDSVGSGRADKRYRSESAG